MCLCIVSVADVEYFTMPCLSVSRQMREGYGAWVSSYTAAISGFLFYKHKKERIQKKQQTVMLVNQAINQLETQNLTLPYRKKNQKKART